MKGHTERTVAHEHGSAGEGLYMISHRTEDATSVELEDTSADDSDESNHRGEQSGPFSSRT